MSRAFVNEDAGAGGPKRNYGLPPRAVGDIVTQDEYTHDVIVPWSERLVLVFDAT